MVERSQGNGESPEYFRGSYNFKDVVARQAVSSLQGIGCSIHVEELYMRDGTPLTEGLTVYADEYAGRAFQALNASLDFSTVTRIISGEAVERHVIGYLDLLNDKEKILVSEVNNLPARVVELETQTIEIQEESERVREESLAIMSGLNAKASSGGFAGSSDLLSDPDYIMYNNTFINALEILSRAMRRKVEASDLKGRLTEMQGKYGSVLNDLLVLLTQRVILSLEE